MAITVMNDHDKEFVMTMDKRLDDTGFTHLIDTKSAYVIWEEKQRIGIITHCILWNKIPFMNLLFIKEAYRKKGLAKKAVIDWEQEMKHQGYSMTLVSTQSDEEAQHLYRKLGYIDCGGLVFHHTPFDQPMEIFLRKVL